MIPRRSRPKRTAADGDDPLQAIDVSALKSWRISSRSVSNAEIAEHVGESTGKTRVAPERVGQDGAEASFSMLSAFS